MRKDKKDEKPDPSLSGRDDKVKEIKKSFDTKKGKSDKYKTG